jgi:hypothetical protein
MFGFLVGWGVFWLLIWFLLFVGGVIAESENAIGWGFIGSVLSAVFLFAVIVGKLVSGI